MTISGVITVTTAGTAVAGPNVGPGVYLLKPDPANTGDYVYIGDDGTGDVSATTGLKLAKADGPIQIAVRSLTNLYFDVATSGDKITYLRVADARNEAYAPVV